MIPFPLLFSFASNSGNLGGSTLQPLHIPQPPKSPYQGDMIHGFSENCQIPEPNLPLFFHRFPLNFLIFP